PAPQPPLTVAFRSPALHGPVREQRTAVQDPGADGDGAGDSAHPHGGGRPRRGPVAELAVGVPAPALRRAVHKQRTRVIAPGDDGGGARDSAHLHRGGGPARPWRAVDGGPGSVAELPVDVPPPAPHRAVPKEGTTVVAPGGDGDGVAESDHGDWHGGDVVEGRVAALPRVAHPPALHRP